MYSTFLIQEILNRDSANLLLTAYGEKYREYNVKLTKMVTLKKTIKKRISSLQGKIPRNSIAFAILDTAIM